MYILKPRYSKWRVWLGAVSGEVECPRRTGSVLSAAGPAVIIPIESKRPTREQRRNRRLLSWSHGGSFSHGIPALNPELDQNILHWNILSGSMWSLNVRRKRWKCDTLLSLNPLEFVQEPISRWLKFDGKISKARCGPNYKRISVAWVIRTTLKMPLTVTHTHARTHCCYDFVRYSLKKISNIIMKYNCREFCLALRFSRISFAFMHLFTTECLPHLQLKLLEFQRWQRRLSGKLLSSEKLRDEHREKRRVDADRDVTKRATGIGADDLIPPWQTCSPRGKSNTQPWNPTT